MCLSTKKLTLDSIVSEFSVFILSKRSNAESIYLSGIQADWNMEYHNNGRNLIYFYILYKIP